MQCHTIIWESLKLQPGPTDMATAGATYRQIRASPHNMRQMQSVVDAAPEVAVEGGGDAPAAPPPPP